MVVKTEYRVVYGDHFSLEKQVNKLLSEGYTLQGGVSHSGGSYYLQAMIKLVEVKEEKSPKHDSDVNIIEQ
jgi:hypothetical protein